MFKLVEVTNHLTSCEHCVFSRKTNNCDTLTWDEKDQICHHMTEDTCSVNLLNGNFNQKVYKEYVED